MRFTIFAGLFLAITIGSGILYMNGKVRDLEKELTRVNREIYQTEEACQVLKAEWAYLNDPSSLQAMAVKHLGMKPTQVVQLMSAEQMRFQDPTALRDDEDPLLALGLE